MNDEQHSLSVHPDKNGAPGADEAFKSEFGLLTLFHLKKASLNCNRGIVVSTAFQILSDPDKRAHYDRYGSDPDDRRSGFASQNAGFGDAGPMFRGGGPEMSPEDLFNMFFGGGGGMNMGMGGFGGPGVRTFTFGPGMNMRQQHARRHHNDGTQVPNSPIWLQLLPLIVLFGFSILSQLPSLFMTPPPPDPAYVFDQTHRHTMQRQTQNLKMDYYVNAPEFKRSAVFGKLLEANPTLQSQLEKLEDTQPNFQPIASSDKVKFPRSFTDFESRIENTRLSQLKTRCENELEIQARRIQQYTGAFGVFGRDEERLKQAREEKLVHCDKLERFGYVIHRNRM